MKNFKLAKISSIATAIFVALAGATSAMEITVPSLLFGFLTTLAFVIWVVCIYHVALSHNKLYGLLGIVFTSSYATLICFNYFLQLSFYGRTMQIPDLLQLSNPDSIFMIIELLGYFFMGLATLALIPLFANSPLEKSIKLLFLINGILGIGGILGYVLRWKLSILFGGLIVWNILMPIAAILVFYYFRRLERSETQAMNVDLS